MPTIEISVVIPCHNAASTISECLRAVFASTFKDFEVIVVDDASNDNSVSLGRQFNCTMLQQSENHGPSFCRNLGVDQAQGGVVLLIDADVLIAADTMDRVAAFFNGNPGISVLQGRYSDACYYRNLFSRYKNYKLAFRELSRPSAEVAFINTSIVAIRRSVFSKYRFDETVRRAEDSLFGWKYYSDGNKIILDPSLQAVHMKAYSFRAFVNYQFRSGANLVDSWIHKSLGSAILSESNSLSNRLQLLRAPLSLLVALVLFSIPFVSWNWWTPALAVLLLCAILLQADYLNYVRKVDGLPMVLASVLIYLVDGFASGLGVAWTAGAAFRRRPLGDRSQISPPA